MGGGGGGTGTGRDPLTEDNVARSGSFTSGGENFSNRLNFLAVFGFATTRQPNAPLDVPPISSTANPLAVRRTARIAPAPS
jgi:hypothetical protein